MVKSSKGCISELLRCKKMIGFAYLLVGEDEVKEEEKSRVIHLVAWSDRGQLEGKWCTVDSVELGSHSGAQQAGESLDLKPRVKIWNENEFGSHQHRNRWFMKVSPQGECGSKDRGWSTQNLRLPNM